MNTAPLMKLSNGRGMPLVGLGTYSRGADKGQFKQAVIWGIEAGYRHLDTAAIYANEEEIGDAINEKINEGSISREQLFVTTKLWNNCHLENDVVPALQESLKKLKLQYVDLYLIHWPFSCNEKGEDTKIDYLETWKGMEKAVELGLTLSIGVSNFNQVQLERLMNNSKIKPTVNQFEIQRGIAVIPKSFTKSRIEENLNIFDFELDETEMKLVDNFNINHHCVPATPFKHFTNYPFSV